MCFQYSSSHVCLGFMLQDPGAYQGCIPDKDVWIFFDSSVTYVVGYFAFSFSVFLERGRTVD